MTGLYEARLQEDLDEIRAGLSEVCDLVRSNFRDSVRAALEYDRRLANETIIRDKMVNEDLKEIDHLCHLFVVRHLPTAGHLRYVSSVLRLSVALERIGDYATTICRVTLQLSKKAPAPVARNIDMLADLAERALATSLDAFLTGDVEKAQQGVGIASQISAPYRTAFEDLVSAGDADRRPTRDLFELLLIMRLLHRTADQADNACELTIFAETGDRKELKRYRILFVDGDNKMMSKLAEVAGKLGFPNAARFRSAGVEPGEAFNAELVTFCERRGYEFGDDDEPTSVEVALDRRRHYHVIIGLDGNPAPHLGDIPYRTVVLEWAAQEAFDEGGVEGAYRYLMHELRELMTTLGVRDEE